MKFVMTEEYFSEDVINAYGVLKDKGLYTGADDKVYLKLSQMLGYYEENGLVYFYTGGDKAIQDQVDMLKNFLVLLNGEQDGLRNALGSVSDMLPADMTIDDILGRFDELIAFLDDYQPLPMNAAINNESADLGSG